MNGISRLATTVVAAGTVVAGLALDAGAAQADPFPAQPHSWCPEEALPFNNIQWDMGVCHTWYTVPFVRTMCGWLTFKEIRLTASYRQTVQRRC
jgi:hypothetical protein